jgi:hypothetical protein
MKKLLFFVKIFMPVFMLSLIFYIVKATKIPEISCRSQFGECSILINEKLSGVKNCDYFTCKKNIDSILSGVFIVDKYNYQLKLPLKIEVNLIEKKPRFSIKSLSENLAVQVDLKGLVLDVREASSLPGFVVSGNLPNPGEKVSSEEYFALQMVYGTTKIQDIDTARIENGYLSVDIKDGKRILFPLEGDRDFILGSLALILNELRNSDIKSGAGEGQVEVIDLRFKNPILK